MKGRTRHPLVCLLSTHPLVQTEIGRILSAACLQVVPRLLKITMNSDVHNVPLPHAPVLVVDSQSVGPATEGLIAGIRNRRSKARIIALVGDMSEPYSFPLLRLGVKGLITYRDVAEQLGRAAQIVAGGGVWVPRAVMSRYLELIQSGARVHAPLGSGKHLSRREKEVLDLLLKNLANKEIAAALNISESTVKFHVSNIFARFGVQRRADLILQSVQETTLTVH